MRRSGTWLGSLFLAACLATTISNGLVAANFLPVYATQTFESLSTALWLGFCAYTVLDFRLRVFERWRQSPLAVVAIVAAVAIVAISVVEFMYPNSTILVWQANTLVHIVIAVLGISLIENLYRRTDVEGRWTIIPLCIGLGTVYAFQLYLFSDAFLFRHLSTAVMAAGALVSAAAAPLLAMTMARNSSWNVPIRVSRDAVFHGVTLIASGVFLVSVASIGSLVRQYGDEWTLVLEVSLIFGSGTVLAVVLTSATAKSYLRTLVLRNFFPYRYDYRVEWRKFTNALSSNNDGSIDLADRLIRSLADIVNSPGGALFQRQNGDFRATARWNVRLPEDTRERVNGKFISRLVRDASVQIIDGSADPKGPKDAALPTPPWLRADNYWLCVPLFQRGELIAFIVLLKPRSPLMVDWEVRELLDIAAGQAASYLAEQEATNALTDALMLESFNKRFAFVMHDIKNMSSQLALVVSNARLHGDDPQFQQDILLTIGNSVSRMNKLLSQLKAKQEPSAGRATNIYNVICELATNHPEKARLKIDTEAKELCAAIDTDSLRSAMTHLIDNALQASGTFGTVTITVRKIEKYVEIDVSDQGSGMDSRFVRDGLFRPFTSTKRDGYGIGAFQTRELIKSAAGQLEVISVPGVGTTMRIILPLILDLRSVA